MRKRVAPDRLFQALDGTQLSVGGSDCRVLVFGVIDEPGRRWVQIALDDGRQTVLTMRLKPTQSPVQVVRELASWLTDPNSTDSVLLHVA